MIVIKLQSALVCQILRIIYANVQRGIPARKPATLGQHQGVIQQLCRSICSTDAEGICIKLCSMVYKSVEYIILFYIFMINLIKIKTQNRSNLPCIQLLWQLVLFFRGRRRILTVGGHCVLHSLHTFHCGPVCSLCS